MCEERELAKVLRTKFSELSEIKVLNRDKRGRMVFYSLNMKNAVARQFKVLFNVYSLNELVEEIKQDCKRIILFGSCSEGTDVKESDVDLFILTNEKDRVKVKINAYQKAGKRIAPIIVNSNEFIKLRREDKPLYDRILKGILLWESE
ncbi:MAG: nucleotidyltransferase domain-containing protein [Candidatus Bathyarchaeia archaeon]|nr:nucleotidyltransferase domain-containing protein [Candidatus Bathyarchaeia archaeon]